MTDSEQWRRVRGVLDKALELAPELRGAYVEEACGGDAALRAEVESLIAAAGRSVWADTVTTSLEPVEPRLLREGQVVAHYRIVSKLGEGGMGAVYEAVDVKLDRTVALKVLLPAKESPAQRRRFAREAKAASALNHPNIVTIYEFASEGDLDFIAMERVEGETLREILTERTAPREKLLEIASQAADAIAKAHAAGIIHRDLKPSNIMITADGMAKVLDFGLAKYPEAAEDSDETQSLSLTLAGSIVGTPAYMSPEQAIGGEVDYRTDIFSFGIILHEIACGKHPFKGSNHQATLHQIASVEPPAVAKIDPTLPPRLGALIEKCLKKDKTQRMQSMGEVSAELSALVKGETRSPLRLSRRAAVAGIAGAGILSAAGLGVRWWRERPRGAERWVTCSITTQQMKDGKPAGDVHTASLRDVFQGGTRFQLAIQMGQSGYLYVVNDGPDETGSNRLWVLYPGAKQPRAALGAGRLAFTGWYVFDQTPGIERLWIVWAQQPVEALEEPIHGQSLGKVENPALAAKIRDILAGLQNQPGMEDAAGGIRIRGAGAMLGGLVELRHQ
jgi:predicted Ser/Thr protein kinase